MVWYVRDELTLEAEIFLKVRLSLAQGKILACNDEIENQRKERMAGCERFICICSAGHLPILFCCYCSFCSGGDGQ